MNDAERHQHLDVVRYLESIGARGHEMRGDPDGPATELCRAAARADLERLRELTSLEVIFTAMCMFVGTIVTALIIGSMVTALSNFDSRKAIAADKLRTLDAYLQIHTVAPDLRIAVRSYCAYRYSSLQGMDDLKLFQDLPPSLATRLAIAVHQRVVARTPFLAALSDNALLAVLARLRTVVFMPGEVVIVEGQPLTEIRWVKKGEVRLLRYLDTPGEHTVRVVGQSEVPDAPSFSPAGPALAPQGF